MYKKILHFYSTQEPVTVWAVGFSTVSVVAILFELFINLKKLPPQLPLFYSQPWGGKQLASLPQFLAIPSTIVLITLINLFVSWHLHSSQRVLKRMLATGTALVSLLLLITAFKVIFIFI